jgi:Zn-dependent protease with chaperone function
MTLEAPSGGSRRHNLGPPDILTLETDLERHASRRRTTAMTAVYVAAAAAEGLVIGWPLRMIWLAPLFALLAVVYVGSVRAFGGRWLARTLQAESARNPRLNRYGNNLSIATGMTPPNVLIVRGDRPNAFAIGLKPNAVVATTGSLNIEDLTLEGLIAHEVVHIRDGEAALASSFIALTGVADLLRRNRAAAPLLVPVMIVLLPAALLLRALRGFWFVDDHEHRADVAAALLTRYPPGVATALRSAVGAKAPGPRCAAGFWFAPSDEQRARLIEEM